MATMKRDKNVRAETAHEQTPIAPHCDPSILHAPGVCQYCNRRRAWQEYRNLARINFTNEHDPAKAPCPSVHFRTDEQRDAWPGNRAPGVYVGGIGAGTPPIPPRPAPAKPAEPENLVFRGSEPPPPPIFPMIGNLPDSPELLAMGLGDRRRWWSEVLWWRSKGRRSTDPRQITGAWWNVPMRPAAGYNAPPHSAPGTRSPAPTEARPEREMRPGDPMGAKWMCDAMEMAVVKAARTEGLGHIPEIGLKFVAWRAMEFLVDAGIILERLKRVQGAKR